MTNWIWDFKIKILSTGQMFLFFFSLWQLASQRRHFEAKESHSASASQIKCLFQHNWLAGSGRVSLFHSSAVNGPAFIYSVFWSAATPQSTWQYLPPIYTRTHMHTLMEETAELQHFPSKVSQRLIILSPAHMGSHTDGTAIRSNLRFPRDVRGHSRGPRSGLLSFQLKKSPLNLLSHCI